VCAKFLVVLLIVPLAACESRLHIAVHPVEREEHPKPNDIPVCVPVPPLDEQNKAFTDYVARALALRLYCDAETKCDALLPLVPTDLYGKPMKLSCPRARLCSAGEDVRHGTPDDACQNVILQGKQFQPLVIPARATRFISIELSLCEGAEEPLATIAALLRGRPKRATIITLDCATDTSCEFTTLHGGNIGHGTVVRVEQQWNVTAYDLPNELREDRRSSCPPPARQLTATERCSRT
jgi:hypothetical protein